MALVRNLDEVKIWLQCRLHALLHEDMPSTSCQSKWLICVCFLHSPPFITFLSGMDNDFMQSLLLRRYIESNSIFRSVACTRGQNPGGPWGRKCALAKVIPYSTCYDSLLWKMEACSHLCSTANNHSYHWFHAVFQVNFIDKAGNRKSMGREETQKNTGRILSIAFLDWMLIFSVTWTAQQPQEDDFFRVELVSMPFSFFRHESSSKQPCLFNAVYGHRSTCFLYKSRWHEASRGY